MPGLLLPGHRPPRGSGDGRGARGRATRRVASESDERAGPSPRTAHAEMAASFPLRPIPYLAEIHFKLLLAMRACDHPNRVAARVQPLVELLQMVEVRRVETLDGLG